MFNNLKLPRIPLKVLEDQKQGGGQKVNSRTSSTPFKEKKTKQNKIQGGKKGISV